MSLIYNEYYHYMNPLAGLPLPDAVIIGAVCDICGKHAEGDDISEWFTKVPFDAYCSNECRSKHGINIVQKERYE